MSLSDSIRAAGVVGAGGAGFPTHVKAAARVDTVVANGAECEPLIHKDVELMQRHAREIVDGVKLLMASTQAGKGIIGLKEKNSKAVQAVRAAVDDPRISVFPLGDFYPSGDEYVLVFEATGRLIPPGGIPLDVGVVVNNVETLYNVTRAARGTPVTEKLVTVAGAVREPVSFFAPVGMSFQDAIAVAGGTSVKDVAVIAGGLMMGTLQRDLGGPITKTCAGLIVLPAEHILVQRKGTTEQAMHRIGKSACDQCSYCTELCPRYVLGYDVQPHKVMRSLGFTTTGEEFWNQYASLCCACGLCTLYACPESLFPKEACDRSKLAMKKSGVGWSGRREVIPHPMYEGRRTPLRQLMKRLGVVQYDAPAHFRTVSPDVSRVVIPLAQHIGSPATPVVRAGERVHVGQVIGEIPERTLGARIHSSIEGVVTRCDQEVVIEKA
jgi:Na+-translocating ferredoxin:NAD+ oxidoreductase RnfC subunit